MAYRSAQEFLDPVTSDPSTGRCPIGTFRSELPVAGQREGNRGLDDGLDNIEVFGGPGGIDHDQARNRAVESKGVIFAPALVDDISSLSCWKAEMEAATGVDMAKLTSHDHRFAASRQVAG